MFKTQNQIKQSLFESTNSNQQSKQSPFMSDNMRKFIMNLQGECKIHHHQYLIINYLKIILLALPFSLTVIGLVLLIHSKRLQKHLMYSNQKNMFNRKSTHIYIKSSNNLLAICKIIKRIVKGKIIQIFTFQELIYEINNEQIMPLSLKIQDQIGQLINKNHLQHGYTYEKSCQIRQLYGNNEHIVKVPTYLQYMFNQLTNSLFIIQYLVLILNWLQKLYNNGILLIVASFIAINVNFYLTRKSFKKIQKIAEKLNRVKILRGGQFCEVQCLQLVPGDVFIPSQIIPCDSLVIRGSLFTNQVSFTGESIPISKISYSLTDAIYKSQHWAYDGSKIISMKQNTLLLAISTGFSSQKGRIIRKILNGKTLSRQIIKKVVSLALKFILMAAIIYGIFFNYMFDDRNTTNFIILMLCDRLVRAIPSPLIVNINNLQAILLTRYSSNGIIGTDPHKTIEGSRILTMCFDKTGTLTKNTVQLQQIYKLNPENIQMFKQKDLINHQLIAKMFACCHSIQIINEVLHGDEIDIKMFQSTGLQLKFKNDNKAIFSIESDQINMQICKINQFQSKFQSMSVLVKDLNTKQMYIFAKGSPQKLHTISNIKYPYFQNLIKKLSLQGYRTIGISYLKINNQQQFQKYTKLQRQQYLQKTNLIGLVTFINQIKDESISTIKTLKDAEIQCKMITGDNIFVAVKTALILGIVPKGKSIIILQGNRLNVYNDCIHAIKITSINDRQEEQEIYFENLKSKIFEEQQYVAVDHDFIINNQEFIRNNNCIVFARTTPDLKRIIVQHQKLKIKQKYQNLGWKDRFFGGQIRKVGMVGDGMNDLMAINESDIGISINSSDAMYGSDFSISNLNQIQTIICQSKAGEQKLAQICQINTGMLFLLFTITQNILMKDMVSYSALPFFLAIVGLFYPIQLALILTPPIYKLNKYIPSTNILGLQYQLSFWGGILISSCGIYTSLTYFRSTDQYELNPDREELSKTHIMSTIGYINYMLIIILFNVSLLQNQPFKQKIYKNKFLMALIMPNFLSYSLIMFFPEYYSWLQIRQFGKWEAFIMYSIVIGTGIFLFAYNQFIRWLKLYRRQNKINFKSL